MGDQQDKRSCPACGKRLRRGVATETIRFDGHSLTYEQPGWYCDGCDELFWMARTTRCTTPLCARSWRRPKARRSRRWPCAPHASPPACPNAMPAVFSAAARLPFTNTRPRRPCHRKAWPTCCASLCGDPSCFGRRRRERHESQSPTSRSRVAHLSTRSSMRFSGKSIRSSRLRRAPASLKPAPMPCRRA